MIIKDLTEIQTENVVDPRNKLNDLSNTEWMIETKSVWFSKPPQRDKLKAQHPATFAETDIIRLIKYFTKRGGLVLDPFVGSGSTLISCAQCGRVGWGIELGEHWVEIAKKRLELENSDFPQRVIQGDARIELSKIPDEFFDFIVTSPPYWAILHKDWDHKVTSERKSKGLKTRYSDDVDDLGNIETYEVFLDELQKVFAQCFRVLKEKKYMCVVVSDFRHESRFVAYHMHISRIVELVGFVLEGITILVQDSKNLYPYGIPYAFVSNIHHQYILVFRKR